MGSRLRIRKKDLLSGSDISKVSKRGLRLRKGKILCIILHEGKGSTWYQLDDQQDRFSVNQNTYFKVDDGTYVKDTVRFMIYLEGISLPLHHGYIQREEIIKDVVDKDTGLTKKYKLYKIKGLNFDSKVIDILLNRHLADEFTKQHLDLPNLVLLILVIVVLIVGFINLGVQFR
jgi:hypothetical protein